MFVELSLLHATSSLKPFNAMSSDLQDRADGVLCEPDAEAQHEFTETAPMLSPLLMSKHCKSQSVRRADINFKRTFFLLLLSLFSTMHACSDDFLFGTLF